MKPYDYLIVGAGLSGAMFAHAMSKQSKRCLVIEQEPYVGGFCYTENINGIECHKFGAHIFRTNSKKVWDFVNSICEFVPFTNSPLAKSKGKIYNLPFNMNTFNQVFGTQTPSEAMAAIDKSRIKYSQPKNLEEHALKLIGKDLYELFVKEYTEKQWGVKCTELSPTIMQRIPLRFTFDNNYYHEKYQGIPICGYTQFIEKLLKDCDVVCCADYFANKEGYNARAEKIIYTGRIDKFYDYQFGKLDYRSVRFEHEWLNTIDNYQGNAVVNYSDKEIPYTRIIEHKHFMRGLNVKGTLISREFPCENDIPSYPLLNQKNVETYERYKALALFEKNVIFFGRLAEFKYYSMNDIIEQFV